MSVTKKCLVAVMILCGAILAHAQTPLHTQSKDTSDIYVGSTGPMANSDIYSCGMDALWKNNYPVALKWFLMGASRDDSRAQFQLGDIYRDGKSVPRDLVQAYKWFDIAATTHGACIDKLPPSLEQETNQTEIDYRDDVAKKMTQAARKPQWRRILARGRARGAAAADVAISFY